MMASPPSAAPLLAATKASRSVHCPTTGVVQFVGVAAPSPELSTVIVVVAAPAAGARTAAIPVALSATAAHHRDRRANPRTHHFSPFWLRRRTAERY